MAGLNFGGNLFGDDKTLQTADYRTAGSHQAENIHFKLQASAGNWGEIHTVTEGKTFYASAIILISATDGLSELGIGAAASEVTILAFNTKDALPLVMAIPTPMKFSSGTRIAIKSAGTDVRGTLIGWEE